MVRFANAPKEILALFGLAVRSHDIVDEFLIETGLTTSWTISD
jgi:hypothetical protein